LGLRVGFVSIDGLKMLHELELGVIDPLIGGIGLKGFLRLDGVAMACGYFFLKLVCYSIHMSITIIIKASGQRTKDIPPQLTKLPNLVEISVTEIDYLSVDSCQY
jgi:hypothetical protein